MVKVDAKEKKCCKREFEKKNTGKIIYEKYMKSLKLRLFVKIKLDGEKLGWYSGWLVANTG